MQVLTNQEFTYRESPAEQDGYGKFKALYGNTLVWNQLVQNGNFADTTGWTGTRGRLSVSSNILSYTITETGSIVEQNRISCSPMPIVNGHKYLLKYDIKPLYANTLYYGFITVQTAIVRKGSKSVIANQWNTITDIMTAQQTDLNGIYISQDCSSSYAVNDVIQFRNVQVFDLTQMGLDITDPSEFPFSLSYYDYNQGTLIPFSGNGIKTTANLLETSKLEIGKNWTYGSASNRAIWQFDCQPETEYHIDLSYSSAINNAVMVYKSGYNTNQLSNVPVGTQKSVDITTPSGCYVVCIQFESGTSVMTTDDIYSQCRAYLKGKESTTDLPISNYFPTGMKSAGTAYDELTPTKAITRIGAVDLGTLDWAYNSNGFMYSTGIVNLIAKPSASTVIANIVSTIQPTTAYTIYDGGNGIGIHINGQIRVRIDNMSTDPVTFKSSMSGVYLYYELATPTETSFITHQSKDEYLFFKSYKGGTEQLLPENGSVPVTAPILADMNYSSGAIEVTTHPNPEQGGETSGDGWYLVGEEATVNALPNEHYAFNNWVLDGEIVSTDPEYTFEVQDE